MEETSPPPPPTTVRRNPHRRARNTPLLPLSVGRFKAADVASGLPPFSLDEATETLPLPPLPSPCPSPLKPADSATSNLNVFLRIRPIEIKSQSRPHPSAKNTKPRGRSKGSPQKVKTKKKSEVCLAVNGPKSVTLTTPKSKLVDSKRGSKSEIYDGFSFVFPPESLQTDVYDKVMNPLVKDFMEGKSALLVAMGPTGSGKTHTMFGSNREPGLVPLALKKIFSSGEKCYSQQRSFYLAMLEIYSVSGRGEKMIDLLSDGAELTLVQSTIKGLEEVPVSDLEGAERLVVRGMSKRSTAPTDANSQSSRSQCIITIRRANDVFYTGNDVPFGNGVLVIADLAGAERDRKTGNMGSRLGESHFINNTSMVFGLCLRSLLEHQKNPKRPLEMHYKNSLLTRYLKDYLEGKKKMTLILTVKPGEDDYVDTSFVLRQAAPYMKIKYTEEVNAPPPMQKRNNVAPAQQGKNKRRKVGGETHVDSTDAVEISAKVDSEKLKVAQAIRDSTIPKTPAAVDMNPGNGGLNAELQKAKRNEVIMTQFARAFWKTLKLYKDKLLKSDNEVYGMRGAILEKNQRIMELEEELAKLKVCQRHSEPAVSSLDENEVRNPASVSEASETTNDSKHFKSLGYKCSSAGSRERGNRSCSSNSNASSPIAPLESRLLSDCDQATVLSIEGNVDKQSENLIEVIKEKARLPFDPAQIEFFPDGNVTGDLLQMVCPDSDTDEGQMPSTENETHSPIQQSKTKASKVADITPSLVIEASRQSIEYARRNAGSSGGGFAEGSDGKVILRFEGSTAIPSRSSDVSASNALGKIDLLSDFQQAPMFSDDEKADKKSEDLLEGKDRDACDNIAGKHSDPHVAEVDPLQMLCPDRDTDKVKIPCTENKIQCPTQLHVVKASEDADSSPSLAIEARRQSIEFTGQNARHSGGGFAEVSGVENVLSFEGSTEKQFSYINPLQMVCPDSDADEVQMLTGETETKPCTHIETSAVDVADYSPSLTIEARKGIEFELTSYSGLEGNLSSEDLIVEPKNDIWKQATAETAARNHITSLNLCQNIQGPEEGDLSSEGLTDEPKNDILEQAVAETAARNRITSLNLCPNIQPEVVVLKNNEVFDEEKSVNLMTPELSPDQILRDEASDNTLERGGSEVDFTSRIASLNLQETFKDSQAEEIVNKLDLMTESPQQVKQESCSSEEIKLESEDEKSLNFKELKDETRKSSAGENGDLSEIVEPKKRVSLTDPKELLLTSLGHEAKSSIERRKENQPIKSLIEVIGKENHASPLKPFATRKPKRRLRPASSMLLKEFTSPDIDPEISKGGRGKASAEEMARSEGSMSLIQVLTRPR